MRTIDNIKPYVSMTPIKLNDDTIEFVNNSNNETIIVDSHTEYVWDILRRSNGTTSVMDISRSINYDSARNIILDLFDLGILKDSSKIYEEFHTISNMESRIGLDLSEREILEIYSNPLKPISDGIIYSSILDEDSSIYNTLSRRYSCRDFSDKLMRLDTVLYILRSGYSNNTVRTIPSAGGLYPIHIFVIVAKDQVDFPKGIYEYNPSNNSIILTNKIVDDVSLKYAFNSSNGLQFGSNISIVIMAEGDRHTSKYSNRGYRFTLMDCGSISQNISLECTNLGIGACLLGGVREDIIIESTNKDYIYLLSIVIGYPKDRCLKIEPTISGQDVIKLIDDKGLIINSWITSFENTHNRRYYQTLVESIGGFISSGISTSIVESKMKGYMEAYEREMSSSCRVDFTGAAINIKGDWVNPTRIINTKSEGLINFSKFIEIDWTNGYRLSDNTIVKVPTDMVYYPFKPTSNRYKIDNACSSGIAAHTNRESAIRGAFLELVERDALMRNWYCNISKPIIKKIALNEYVRSRTEYWDDLGYDVIVIDISEYGIPVAQVIILGDKFPFFVCGASSGLKFQEAVNKAFDEAEQRLIHNLNYPDDRNIGLDEVNTIIDHELLYAQSRKFHKYIEYLWKGEYSTDIAEDIDDSKVDDVMKSMNLTVVDINLGPLWIDCLHVVRVFSEELIPIHFNKQVDLFPHHTMDRNIDHSKKRVPHYFA